MRFNFLLPVYFSNRNTLVKKKNDRIYRNEVIRISKGVNLLSVSTVDEPSPILSIDPLFSMTIDDVDSVVPFSSVDIFDSVSEVEAQKIKIEILTHF